VKQPGTPMALETVSVDVPESALESYEAALSVACATVGFFRDNRSGAWRVEGVKLIGSRDSELVSALILAASLTGTTVPLQRVATPADGWLARSNASFPEQLIGRQFSVRGTHVQRTRALRRSAVTLDAGLAFGSGEHGSTRGCLRALERVAWRRPQRVLDLGTGSGILAMCAARLLRKRVLATDIEPWSVRVAQQNAKLNQLGRLTRFRLANGWRSRAVRGASPYDLVFANILARPLCLMASRLATHMAPGGTAILAGLVQAQMRAVVAAHRRCGLHLEACIHEEPWTTLILRRPHALPA